MHQAGRGRTGERMHLTTSPSPFKVLAWFAALIYPIPSTYRLRAACLHLSAPASRSRPSPPCLVLCLDPGPEQLPCPPLRSLPARLARVGLTTNRCRGTICTTGLRLSLAVVLSPSQSQSQLQSSSPSPSPSHNVTVLPTHQTPRIAYFEYRLGVTWAKSDVSSSRGSRRLPSCQPASQPALCPARAGRLLVLLLTLATIMCVGEAARSAEMRLWAPTHAHVPPVIGWRRAGPIP